MSKPVIVLNELTKSYGKHRGIENISFTVEQGEVFGFIGPNGAGKSTTIRTLMGLLKPSNGGASIFGLDCSREPNVGDIATQEFPLSFFMDLAYDFERWGTTALNTTDAYTRLWVKRQFGRLSEVQQAQIADILTDYTRMIHKCIMA